MDPRRPPQDDQSGERNPSGPRTPYPVERPGITDRPGRDPDVLPGGLPPADLPKF